MVHRASRFRAAALAATLTLPLAATGCSQAVNAGLGLLGVHRTSTPRAPASAKAGAKPRGVAAAKGSDHDAVIGGLEWAPAQEWQRWAVGRPYSPARVLSGSLGPKGGCTPASAGVSRVLPVNAASAGEPVTTLGPFELRVANLNGGLFDNSWAESPSTVGQVSMSRAAETGTYGQGCSTNVFAYVTLASWGTSDPVVVR